MFQGQAATTSGRCTHRTKTSSSRLIHLEEYDLGSTSSNVLQRHALIARSNPRNERPITLAQLEISIDLDSRGISVRKRRTRVVLCRLNHVDVEFLAAVGGSIGGGCQGEVRC